MENKFGVSSNVTVPISCARQQRFISGKLSCTLSRHFASSFRLLFPPSFIWIQISTHAKKFQQWFKFLNKNNEKKLPQLPIDNKDIFQTSIILPKISVPLNIWNTRFHFLPLLSTGKNRPFGLRCLSFALFFILSHALSSAGLAKLMWDKRIKNLQDWPKVGIY